MDVSAGIYPPPYQGRQSVLKSEGNKLENEEVRGYMLS